MAAHELSDAFADTFLRNVYRLWLIPEVQGRLSSGTISGDTKIWAGQVIFELDHAPEVRLNEEVNGTFHVRPEAVLPEGMVVDARNAVDIAPNVVYFEPDDHDRPNGAHITVLFSDKGFFIAFDMRYNSAVVAAEVVKAKEFLEIARHAYGAGSTRGLLANLHIAVESLAKAHLLLHPDSEILASKRHGFLRGRYNLHFKRGGTDERFAALLNRLDELRNPARYATERPALSDNECQALLEDSDAMLKHVLMASPGRTQRLVAPEL